MRDGFVLFVNKSAGDTVLLPSTCLVELEPFSPNFVWVVRYAHPICHTNYLFLCSGSMLVTCTVGRLGFYNRNSCTGHPIIQCE